MKLITTNKDYIPTKWSKGATWYDLKVAEEITIYPREIKLVSTGVKTNFASKVYARSSLALKKHLLLANWVGVIDEDYRWELKVMLLNVWDEAVTLKRLDRVAQIECEDFKTIIDKELYNNWADTERGAGWFWSTGWYN